MFESMFVCVALCVSLCVSVQFVNVCELKNFTVMSCVPVFFTVNVLILDLAKMREKVQTCKSSQIHLAIFYSTLINC